MLTTTDAVIDALGGTVAVAQLTARFPQQVSQWRRHKVFPSTTYTEMMAALARIGQTAPPALWRMGVKQRAGHPVAKWG
jgi:hypothetical protein